MSERSRLMWTLAATVLGASMAIGSLIYLMTSKDPKTAASLVSAMVGMITFAWGIVRGVWRWRQPDTAETGQISQAAEALASEMQRAWVHEAARRRITAPLSIRVAWDRPSDVQAVAVSDVLRRPETGAGPRPLPGATTQDVGRLLTRGVLDEIYRLYASLGHGRLAVIGERGSGKTGLLVRLLLAALHERVELSLEERQAFPVPVLIPLTGWDPRRQKLRRFAANFIDQQVLSQTRHRGTGRSLIDGDRIALFLDGLDEMPSEQQAMALRQIEGLSRTRVVLTSRIDEYRQAVDDSPFMNAAVVRLLPVPPDEAADYLERGNSDEKRAAWRLVTSRLRDAASDSALKSVLSTPLMLSLAKSAYRGRQNRPAGAAGDRRPSPPQRREGAALKECPNSEGRGQRLRGG